MSQKPPAERIDQLWRERPRKRFVRVSLTLFVGILASSWAFRSFDLSGLFSERRQSNLERFLEDIRPYPLRGQDWDWSVVSDWSWSLFTERGAEAMVTTLAISIAAVVLAGAAGLVSSFAAARNFSVPSPYLASPRNAHPVIATLWFSVGFLARALLLFSRSLPEYLLAFFFLAVLGPSAWPAVLALAIHNFGIVGRLNAEVIENHRTRPPAALRALGARRTQIAVTSLLPSLLPRFLLFFFYRWESCVREATVLGMLGIVSLGYLIQDARARGHDDVLMFWVLLGSMLVVAGDVLSAIVRSRVRRAK